MNDAILRKLRETIRNYAEMNEDLKLEIENLTSMVTTNRRILEEEKKDYESSVEIIDYLEEMKY